ncbi:MAG: HNH endonuclease, partial [Desulfurellales bacterium]
MPKRSPNFNPLRAVRRVTRVARTVSHADHQRMYWGRWRRASVLFLDGHPFCVRCEEAGRAVPATVTDHVIPHRGDDRLFWDERNWQPLCKLCHDRKTASEDGGLGRARTGEGAAVHGTGTDDAFAEYCATMGAGMAEASVQRTDGGMPHAPKRATSRGSSSGSGAPTEG